MLCPSDRDPHGPPVWKPITEVKHKPPGRLMNVCVGEGSIGVTHNHLFLGRRMRRTPAPTNSRSATWSRPTWHAGARHRDFRQRRNRAGLQSWVEDHHTYFVLTDDGKHSVLVHNDCDSQKAELPLM